MTYHMDLILNSLHAGHSTNPLAVDADSGVDGRHARTVGGSPGGDSRDHPRAVLLLTAEGAAAVALRGKPHQSQHGRTLVWHNDVRHLHNVQMAMQIPTKVDTNTDINTAPKTYTNIGTNTCIPIDTLVFLVIKIVISIPKPKTNINATQIYAIQIAIRIPIQLSIIL